MNFKARQLLYAFVVLTLAFRAESLSDVLKSDVQALNPSLDDFRYSSIFDRATDTMFNVFSSGSFRLFVFRFDDSRKLYQTYDMDNVDFIYNNYALYLNEEETLFTCDLEDFDSQPPNSYDLPHNSTSLFRTMYLDGVDENRLVILYENSVKFVTINGSSAPTFTDMTVSPSVSGGINFTNVGSGIVYAKTENNKNSYYFLNFSGGVVQNQALTDKIDLSSGPFTVDRQGYIYTADGAEIIRQDINGNAKKSVLAQSSSSVVALHYDYLYDVIYATGATDSHSVTLYVIPAGETFDFSKERKSESGTVSEIPGSFSFDDLYFDIHSGRSCGAMSAYYSASKNFKCWDFSLQAQECAKFDTDESACYKDSQHCRFSLKDMKCVILPDCEGESLCVNVTPIFTDFTPKSGSTQGNTTVTISFKDPLPSLDIIMNQIQIEIGGTSVNNVKLVDSRTITFLTPEVEAGEAVISVQIGKLTLDKGPFIFYSCESSDSCSSCLHDRDDRPECVFDPNMDKCTAKFNASDATTQISSEPLCPAITNLSRTTVTLDSVITVTLNVFLESRIYYCTFHNETGTWSTMSSNLFGKRVNCGVPNDLSIGEYDFWLSPYSESFKTYSTMEGKNVRMNVVDCGGYDSCSKCAEIDGCSWCYEGTFKCVKSDSCSGLIQYDKECPYIANKLYADANTLEKGKKFKAEIQLKNAKMPENLYNLIKCYESDGTDWNATDTSCKYINQDDIVCKCDLSVEAGVEMSSYVALNISGGVLTEAPFYVVKCEHTEPEICFNDDSTACVWDLEQDKCIVLPTDHKSVSWVSDLPRVLEIPSFIDANNQDVKVEFNTFINTTTVCFECMLLSNETVVRKVDLIPGNETTAFCNFGDLTKTMSLETGQNVTGLHINISVSSKNARDNSRILSLFDGLNDKYNGTSILINCGASDTKLDCSACKIDGCMWSRKKAMCTAAPDETTGSDCPKVLSISPNKVIFDEGDNITLGGELLVSGLKVRFTSQENSKNIVEGDLVFINATRMNFTVKEKFDPASYNVSVFVSSGRSFANSSLVLEVPENPVSTELLIEIIVPVGVVVIILIIIAIILAKKRVFRAFRFDVNKKPDFLPFSYATDIWNANRSGGTFPADQAARDEFRALLQDPQICAALCKATSSTEADSFSGAMVYVYATNGHCLDLLMSLVDQEVESVPNSTQLFRGNSLASKAFRAYSRMVGLNYLWMTLARFVHELNHLTKGKSDKKDDEARQDADGDSGPSILSTEFEVDPTKLASGADEESQSYLLSQRARQLVLCIINSTRNLPPELRLFAAQLKTRVTQRFPEADHIAIGGMFFLRFICPAIIAPHSYALLMTEDRKRPVVPNDQLQRQLILLGKVLQNLANGVLFGKKEPFMISMNDFITNNLPAINEWMDTIGENCSFTEQPTAVPAKTVTDSYSFLAAHVRTNMNKIRNALSSQGAPSDLAQRLEYAVGN